MYRVDIKQPWGEEVVIYSFSLEDAVLEALDYVGGGVGEISIR
jgi:hypothetical protein